MEYCYESDSIHVKSRIFIAVYFFNDSHMQLQWDVIGNVILIPKYMTET